MRTLTAAFSLLLAMLSLAPSARAADEASVHAILIMASKDKAPADPRLAPYEATLQRNLPESSFRFVNEGRAAFGGKSDRAAISLGSGHRIELSGGSRNADGIHIKVRWLNGKSTVMNNAFTFQPGIPIVLGQRPSGDGNVPFVLLIAR
jgi:hypothetical protein